MSKRRREEVVGREEEKSGGCGERMDIQKCAQSTPEQSLQEPTDLQGTRSSSLQLRTSCAPFPTSTSARACETLLYPTTRRTAD